MSNRYPAQRFDFFGCTFRPQRSMNRDGELWYVEYYDSRGARGV